MGHGKWMYSNGVVHDNIGRFIKKGMNNFKIYNEVT